MSRPLSQAPDSGSPSFSSCPLPEFTVAANAAPVQAAALMQQPLHHPLPGRVARQQQQSNGIPEFQPRPQQGSHATDDSAYTLSAYLERASRAGEMPGARPSDFGEGVSQARKQQQQ
jgi:hypothetical protein